MRKPNKRTTTAQGRRQERVVSRKELLKTCCMAYKYILDQSSMIGPTRLSQKDERELGRRIALTWIQSGGDSANAAGKPPASETTE